MLELKNISFSYGRGNDQLKDISMTVKKGQVVGLIGENGAGKSTLFHNILGLLKPKCGKILYDGIEVQFDKKFLREYRQKINLVMQDPDRQIFYSRVYDDIMFPLKNLGIAQDEAEKRVENALENLGIKSIADRPVHYLSYGQKKRVCIAGVLAMNCETILLDEPTAGLDPGLSADMEKLISELKNSGKSLIVSSHDMDFIYGISDYIYLMKDGRFTGEGKPEEIFLDEDKITESGLRLPHAVRLHLHANIPLFRKYEEIDEYISGLTK